MIIELTGVAVAAAVIAWGEWKNYLLRKRMDSLESRLLAYSIKTKQTVDKLEDDNGKFKTDIEFFQTEVERLNTLLDKYTSEVADKENEVIALKEENRKLAERDERDSDGVIRMSPRKLREAFEKSNLRYISGETK